MPSPHDVLGVDRDADPDAIRAAYRDRVLEAHPDHGGSVRQFRRVRNAYEEVVGEGRSTGDLEEPSGPGPWAPNASWERDRDTAESTVPPRHQPHEVEYLDYEVLADHGWSLTDDALFERAADADLDPDEYGRFLVEPGDSLLEGAEACGFTWPFSCRGGACANCAVAVLDGTLSQPASHILPDDLTDDGIKLSCVGAPVTDDLRVVYNVKHIPEVEDLLLPPGPFKRVSSDD